MRAPEPPPVQAPLPPTMEPLALRDDAAPWKWGPGGLEALAGGVDVGGGAGQGLGLGQMLGIGLVAAQGSGSGSGEVGGGHGAPEGFRPPRLRMLSNPGTLSNPGGCRAAVARWGLCVYMCRFVAYRLVLPVMVFG